MLLVVQFLFALPLVVRGNDLNFLVMGDWGGAPRAPYTGERETRTAKSMNVAAEDLDARFTLALGDNFYWNGVESVDSPRFEGTFEQCFSGENLQDSSGHTFHVIAGNHDHYGNVQAQIDYSSRSKRWSFPSLYYTFTETAPDGATVQFVMIDTVTLAGQSQLNAEDVGGLMGDELPGPPDLAAAQSQTQWIESTMAASSADYLIVAGHYPVHSAAEHGPTGFLSAAKFPYLTRYKASAYLCGHDHAEQYIDVGDGVQYHVIGSANLVGDFRQLHRYPNGEVKFKALPSGGFASVSANKDRMIFKHYDGDGNLLYTAPSIAPRGGPHPSPSPPPGQCRRRRCPPPPPPPSPPPGQCRRRRCPLPPSPRPSPSPAPSPHDSCEGRCHSAGHCCTGRISSYAHPSCAMGCAIAAEMNSPSECKDKCYKSDKMCAWLLRRKTKFDNCGDCPSGCNAAGGVQECLEGCDYYFSTLNSSAIEV